MGVPIKSGRLNHEPRNMFGVKELKVIEKKGKSKKEKVKEIKEKNVKGKKKEGKKEEINEEQKKESKNENKRNKNEKKSKKETKKEEIETKEKPVKETEKKQEKEYKEEVKKAAHKPQKLHIIKRGKKYKEVVKLIDKTKSYPPEDAVDLISKTSVTKFDSAIELHIKLGIKPEQSDQNIRTVVDLPEGSGKVIKIAVIVDAQKEKEIKDAGADFVGSDELISKIEKGFIDFDILVATPDMMGKIGKLGKVLGTKGLMPNPKTETVTDNPAKVVKLLKKGRIEIRNDKQGIVHTSIGRVSQGKEKIISNFKVLIEKLLHAKPSSTKGRFIKGLSICTTMGPSVKVDIDKSLKLIQRH